MKACPGQFSQRPRQGFSLIEILLAVGILGIGLVMVATVFPVGAEWTRRGVNDSVAQVVAQDALSILQAHYPFGGSNAPTPTSVPPGAALMIFPNINSEIPIDPTSGSPSERCYNFGAAQVNGSTNTVCPGDPARASYFWTALIRSTNDQPANAVTRKYDVYILVFKKGDVGQTFTPPLPTATFVPFTDSIGQQALGADPSLPILTISKNNIGPATATLAGVYNYNSATWTTRPIPNIGEYGIGATSGTAFRQYAKTTYSASSITTGGAAPQPGIAAEKVIIAPPADGTTASPLIYIFQTTLIY